MKKYLIDYAKKLQRNGREPAIFDRWLLSALGTYRSFKTKLRGTGGSFYSRAYLKSRNAKRNLKGKTFKFVTIDQASIWTAEWIKTFPDQYDLIVGVPRSGMLVATIIALKLGKGLTTPDLYAEGKYWHSSHLKMKSPIDEIDHVLLVDDAVDTGRAMSQAIDQIRSSNPDVRITSASLIVKKAVKSLVDLHHAVIEPPRAHEWNILHRKIASYWGHGVLAVDMDGVLCANCPAAVDQDEGLYIEWIKNAKPYLIPAFEIDAIVSNRLEKYRSETELWLEKQNVKYKKLYMWDITDKSERDGRFAKNKINQLLLLKPDMYWESSWEQSQAIWAQTRIPTLCIDVMTLLS